MEWEFILSTLISLFAIINPMGAVPNYVALTQGYTTSERRKVVKKAVIVALFVLIIFTVIGRYIFDFLNITVDSFRIAGGIVLFIIAMDMVKGNTPQSKLNPKEKDFHIEREQVGVIPLGIPLLAGPGSITTVMITVSDGPANRLLGILIVVIGIIIVLTSAYLVLRNSDVIFKKIGRTGTKIFSRIMGLMLGAIAVQFVADGIIGLFGI
ncbi:MAG: MarC family protein [Candidatus Thermoplasmatota archaeon]|nr:MarC family protein [Candidatus Thermoplasmatota archaeon]